MVIDFFIPKLEQTEEVTIISWLVDDRVQINEGDEIIEIETDKAVVPVPANASGYLRIGPYKAGDVVKTLTILATIGSQDQGFTPGNVSPESQAREVVQTSTDLPPTSSSNGQATPTLSTPDKTGLKITPVAQKMAADLGVNLNRVSGSGEHNKITKADVQQAVTQTPEPQQAAKPAPKPVVNSSPTTSSSGEDILERVPLKGIRGVIARRMAESVQTTARVTLVTEVDASELVTLREQLKAKFATAWSFAPAYNDLLAMIVSNGLRQFPYMNARLSTDGTAIEQLRAINMGMAVDTERGLLVPVIKNIDQLGLQALGSRFRELASKAKAGKSSLDDLSGGTFTITSLGIYRVEAFTPVINLPNVAILGIGRITPKPVVKSDEIVIRKMLTLSLVFDHRLTDGAPAARFLDYICELIEEPYLLFLTKR